MRRHWQYLKYVLRHKWYVFLACLELGVPLWIAITHDWDKFLPDEWFAYAQTFYKPNGEKRYQESVDFAMAWMHHQHRNKHHWQYWLSVNGSPLPSTSMLMWDRGELQEVVRRETVGGIRYELRDVTGSWIDPTPMPDVYRREMLADWRGAGRALGNPDTRAWYLANYHKIKLHDDTRMWLDVQLDCADSVVA